MKDKKKMRLAIAHSCEDCSEIKGGLRRQKNRGIYLEYKSI